MFLLGISPKFLIPSNSIYHNSQHNSRFVDLLHRYVIRMYLYMYMGSYQSPSTSDEQVFKWEKIFRKAYRIGILLLSMKVLMIRSKSWPSRFSSPKTETPFSVNSMNGKRCKGTKQDKLDSKTTLFARWLRTGKIRFTDTIQRTLKEDVSFCAITNSITEWKSIFFEL